jgi:pimeloyl-ACP methyl ester carboxylesterase
MVRGRYEAHMNATGDSLLGHWRQGGVAVELALVRTAAPAAPKRPQEPHPPYPYDTLAVAFDNMRADGVRLAGTLTLPRGKGPHPCALLITGSGPEDRDEAVFGHRPFKVLADHLTRQGIAVLRVDDRGVGGSTGSSRGATSEDFAGDVLAGVEFLRTRAEVDKRRIGLIGHSEGGLLGPMVPQPPRTWRSWCCSRDPGSRGTRCCCSSPWPPAVRSA